MFEKECVPLIEAEALARFGGKAVQLGAAMRAGLRVPPGLALSVDFVEATAVGSPAAHTCLAACAEPLGLPVAVRSSAPAEDSEQASFAGQHCTVLNVQRTDAIAAAVTQVHASGKAEAALAYRQERGLEGEAVRMAVVVQRQIDAEIAGVLFTRHPVTGADERVIEATWGLGEAVVQGLVTPDQYRIAASGNVLEQTPGDKDIAVRFQPGGGTVEQPVEPNKVHALCLTETQLAELHKLATHCQSAFGQRLDIEWALDNESTLWLLQCRAITT